ncbi:MAG: type II toxin-antitoxin system ParD family antitoxin [Verrucomicrobiota bacterium JB022]|nr:type II toxin-antitoxin system ParD family antitoxin [Verrucomicrobiota bacterium JB022]
MQHPPHIHLTSAQATLAQKEVASGRFRSELDVVDAGLEMLTQESTRLDALRQALEEGEQSGEAVAFDFQSFLATCRAGRRA